jgi:hypothetical protein
MTFTIEPMINAGRREIRTMPDQWTVKTKDRSLSAQWEHTLLVTNTGVEVLTWSEGSNPPPRLRHQVFLLDLLLLAPEYERVGNDKARSWM